MKQENERIEQTSAALEKTSTCAQPITTGESSNSCTESSNVQFLNSESEYLEEMKTIDEQINELKKKRAEVKRKQSQDKNRKLQPSQRCAMIKDVVTEYLIDNNNIVQKKLARIKYNRNIQWTRVDEFTDLINTNMYYPEYPILVSQAEVFHKQHPEIEICNMCDEEIPEKDLGDFFIGLDGQHRTLAYIHLIHMGKIKGPIPGVVVKDDITNVADFLRAINPAGSWSNFQKMEVCALTSSSKYKDLCLAIRKLCEDGFNRSTASEIYIGKPITSRQVDALLKGAEPKNEIAFNIKRGDAFIEACTKAGIETKFLTKRYFIEGYMDFLTEKGEEVAKKTLNALPRLDINKLKSIKSKSDFKDILVKHNLQKTL